MHALEHNERRMSLVQVPDRRRDSERAESADAADAQDDLLLQPGFAVAAVEPRGEIAILGRVLLQARVQQIQVHAAERDFPDIAQDRAIAERHGDDARVAVGLQRLLDGHVGPVQSLVGFLLPALCGNVLVEIALRVHEADAHERHAEVARLLAVVAGEYAQAPGINRQRLVERELSGEIRNRGIGEIRIPPRHPVVS